MSSRQLESLTLAEFFTTNHRLLARVQTGARPLSDLLNDRSQSFLLVFQVQVFPLHLVAKSGTRAPEAYLSKKPEPCDYARSGGPPTRTKSLCRGRTSSPGNSASVRSGRQVPGAAAIGSLDFFAGDPRSLCALDGGHSTARCPARHGLQRGSDLDQPGAP